MYEQEWKWRTAELGDLLFSWLEQETHAPLPDVSAQAWESRRRHWEQVRDELDRIPVEELSRAGRTNHRAYRHQLCTLINSQRFRMFERPANSDTTFWGMLLDSTDRVLPDTDQAQAYLAQLGTVARFVDQNLENMRAGLARGFAPPRITMVDRDSSLRTINAQTDPAKSAFVNPLHTLPASIPAATRDALIGQAEAVIAEQVMPAFARLGEFITEQYLPGLPERIDVASQPDGAAFYQAMLDEYSTTGLTGEQIHQIGLEQVAALLAEMEQVAAGAGYPSAAAMLEFMRHDPQFVETTPRGLLRRAAWHAKQFDEVAHHYFGRMPRMRFGIVEPDPDIAPYYTAGRGGPHRYTLNTYNLPARKLYSLPALTLHEAAPGHAFQVPFALEMTGHPMFRRKDYISAYGEGWALYTERLGVEMGMYETPYEMMGMLSYQMWRAVRLVVDPGIHILGWSRDRALAYLAEHTALDQHEVTTEVDRYIAWPGQATSYYLGMMRILELRAQAEAALGERFSLPAFHDQVLSVGSVPLDVLADEVAAFIADGGRSPFQGQDS